MRCQWWLHSPTLSQTSNWTALLLMYMRYVIAYFDIAIKLLSSRIACHYAISVSFRCERFTLQCMLFLKKHVSRIACCKLLRCEFCQKTDKVVERIAMHVLRPADHATGLRNCPFEGFVRNNIGQHFLFEWSVVPFKWLCEQPIMEFW